jgi:DeoR family fructose operon transcriptional repressor
MFADERREKILELIAREGTARISELTAMFGVSSETVRRDLAELSRGKKIHKVHGGAIALRRPAREEDYSVRVKQNSEGKRCIGRYAASLLRDGDIVLFDSGATTEEIARSVFGLKDVTFITHSLNVASIFAEKRNAGDFSGKIVFLGGALELGSSHTGGEIALAALERFSADKAFLGVTSVSPRGLMMWNENEGGFTAGIAARASEVYVVADSSKFGVDTFYKFLDLDQVDHIITDDRTPITEQLRAAIRSAGAELHCVKTGVPENGGEETE